MKEAPRPVRGQLRCNSCRTLCAPKQGDWFVSKGSKDQQIFLCKKCEQEKKDEFERAIPIR